MDMDQKIDELATYRYTGTTAMRSRMPSGSGSGSSESSVDGPPPMVDLTGGPLDRMEKPPDLDKMVTPQADQEKTPIKEMPPDSDKKKKTKKNKQAKGGEAAGASTSMPKEAGPTATVLQEALDQLLLTEQLDQEFGKLPEPAPLGVQAPAISLQEVVPMEGERMEEASEAVPPREVWGTTPVLDFTKLSVSAGTPERQEVSTLPVLPPVPEQAALQDIEMAATEPETEDVLGEMELMFGKLKRDLTPAK